MPASDAPPPTSSTTRDGGPPGSSGPSASGFSVILKPVFIPASLAIIGLLAFTIIASRAAGDELDELTTRVNQAITDGVGWWYVIAVNIFLVFCLYCAVSRIGRIRLGRDDERPEFSMISWFLMLFSAGMGIGLVFFGVAEPLSHYVIPPEAFGNEAQSTQAAQESVGLMMLQWGLHPWAIYAVVGLGLAYMTFRRGRPLAVRWLLEPLVGRRRVEGWVGHTIDTIAIVGTLFGVATSFGFGVSQIMGGFEYLGWAQRSPLLIIIVISAITAVAVWSVVSGVHKGLKWLSNINMTVAAVLALIVFVLGPTIVLLKAIPENAGMYLTMLPQSMLHVGAFTTDGWEGAWTIAYWGWWTSWAPFVGMFIARISRGRTIREYIVGVLLAPTAVSLVWFTIFGDSAIIFQREAGTLAAADPATGELSINSDTALFQFFESMPGALTVMLSIIAMCVVTLFFVTSSDSGSLVIDMLASGGSTETPVVTRVYWAVLEGVAAAALLVVGGDVALTALQSLSLSTAAPFSIILVLACVSLLRAFRHEVATMPEYMQVMPAGDDAPPQQHPRFRDDLGDVSATLAGLDDGLGRTGDGDRAVISYRQLNPRIVRVDPATGRAGVAETVDPLAGEYFDTPEFESSQEYLVHRHNHGDGYGPGGHPSTEADATPPRSGR